MVILGWSRLSHLRHWHSTSAVDGWGKTFHEETYLGRPSLSSLSLLRALPPISAPSVAYDLLQGCDTADLRATKALKEGYAYGRLRICYHTDTLYNPASGTGALGRRPGI